MNRICYPMTRVPEYLIGTITVPEGGLYAGDVVIVDEMDGSIKNNFTQFLATQPTSADLADHVLGIVISGGNFDELLDGRRPLGNSDYTTYKYQAGTTAPVLFLESSIIFYLSDDCLDVPAIKGDYVFGQSGSYKLEASNTKPAGILNVAKVVGKHNFRLGGAFGGEFTSGNICRVCPLIGEGGEVGPILEEIAESLNVINSGEGV